MDFATEQIPDESSGLCPGPARPFVKWAGGKRSLLKALIAHLPQEAIATYHEPFVGGGALFFALRSRIEQAVLSDMNIELMITYRMIQEYPDAVLACLHEHQRQHGKQYYQAIRRDYPPADSAIALAAQFIYLNRTCYNGLYRVNRQGRFNVPMGRYKNPVIADPENIQAVSRALQDVDLWWRPFVRTVPARDDFIYCDPPYDGAYDQYTRLRFDSTAQESLEQTARDWSKAGAKVMLSNANTPFIRQLYCTRSWRIHEVVAPRMINSQAAGRKPVTELIITSYDV